MNSKLQEEETDKLFEAILSLKDIDECRRFFEDVCTIPEIKAIAQRYDVAVMLNDGRTYGEISEITGASGATISRVNRSLNYGADGYKITFERLRKNKSED